MRPPFPWERGVKSSESGEEKAPSGWSVDHDGMKKITVGELIEMLQKMPVDAVVQTEGSDDWGFPVSVEHGQLDDEPRCVFIRLERDCGTNDTIKPITGGTDAA